MSPARSGSAALADRAAVTWKGRGAPASSRASASPSMTAVSSGISATLATISGTRAVISSKLRVNTRDGGAVLVDLHPDAVQLGIDDRREPGAGQRAGDVGCAGGQHRPDRPAQPKADPGERRRASGRQQRGRLGRGTEQHRGAKHLGQRHAEGDGQAVLHGGVGGSLTDVLGDQPAQERLFRVGGRAEQLADRDRAPRRGTGTGLRRDPLQPVVHLHHGERGLHRGRRGSPTDAQPTPVRRCRTEPDRYVATSAISEGSAWRSASTISPRLAIRDLVAAIPADASASMRNSMDGFSRVPPTAGDVGSGPTTGDCRGPGQRGRTRHRRKVLDVRAFRSGVRAPFQEGCAQEVAIDPASKAVVLIEYQNAIRYDYPMFSRPMSSAEFIAELDGSTSAP